jgi:hypothetical protein
MKTPMQEFIEVLKIHRDTAFEKEKMCEAKAKSYYEGRAKAFEDAISFAEVHLEKEKEVMCEFAFNCGDEIKDQNNWRSPRNLTNYEVIQDFYNETFNTKEK